MQIDTIQLQKLLLIDIQTVAEHLSFEAADAGSRLFWQQKFGSENQDYAQKAALIPEFGKLICVSLGGFVAEDKVLTLKVKTFFGIDEKQLLQQVAQALTQYKPNDKRILAGHNVKEFDLPFLCKRLAVNNIKMPEILNIWGLKPWEVLVLDTMQLWQFGSFKGFTSLKLLAHSLGVQYPQPIEVLESIEIQQNYHKSTQDTTQLVTRSQQNVGLIAQVVLRLKNMEMLPQENIRFLG